MPLVAPVINWSATSATLAYVFVWWHTWNYDRWRCLILRQEDWFRTIILYVHLIGCTCFVAGHWMDVHVVYKQAFVNIGTQVVPAPWQFWPSSSQTMFRASGYLLTVMFWCLQIAHAEEMIFWGYLIRAIRTPNYACAPTPRIWVKAPCFRVWLSVSTASGALLWGAVNIETENLDMMRAYLYLITACISLLLSFGSLALCVYLPSFIQRIKDFGAGFEMQERLAVFKELNMIRTIARVFYSTAFVSLITVTDVLVVTKRFRALQSVCRVQTARNILILLSADAISPTHRIVTNKFAQSFVAVAAQAGIIVVFGLSVIILLPRNMTLESAAPGTHTNASFHPMMSAYKRPTPDRLANHHFWEMGQRLNLEQDALAAILPDRQPGGVSAHAGVAGHAYELSHSTSNHHHQQHQHQQSFSQAPGQGDGQGRRASVRGIQEMMGRLVGMESQRASMPPPPTKIVVTTHEEQRSD